MENKSKNVAIENRKTLEIFPDVYPPNQSIEVIETKHRRNKKFANATPVETQQEIFKSNLRFV